LRLHFEPGPDGGVHARWLPQGAFRSYPDRLHGGVAATLLDSAMVHALFERGVAGVTAELTIRYRHPVTLGDEVEVRGWVEGERHGIFLCRADLRQLRRLAVRATAKFVAMDPIPLPS
jgi:acyl-coenzyme A thioesterase PaaI-like protein